AQPGRAAQLAPAAAHAAEQRRFIADADLLQLDARAEGAREVAHELAEVDASLGGEVDGELVAVELPLRLTDLHLQAVLRHLFARDAAHARLVTAQRHGAIHLIGSGNAQQAERRDRRGAARRAARTLP